MEEKLIDFVKNNDFIYNKKSRHYKNIYLRDNKFEELAKELNIPGKKLKDRWRTLRDKFYKELKKQYVPSGSGFTSPKKKWRWMDQLMFLKDVDNSNTSTSGNYPTNLNFSNCESTSTTLSEVLSPTFPSNENLFDFPDTLDCNASTPTTKKNKVENILLEAKKEMSDVITLAKDIFTQPAVPERTAPQQFFDMLAKQTEDASLSTVEFSLLQMELLTTFNKIVYGF